MDRLADIPVRHLVTGLLIVAALTAMSGAGLMIARAASSGPTVEVFLPDPVEAPEPASPELQVYLSGAVHNPGVYAIREGDRLADAVAAAGGLTADADLDRVNLAARLSDEDHWHIPATGDEVDEPTDGGVSADGGVNGAEKIDLNRADAALLETLPGIGEVRAASIVAYRRANGPFLEVEELVEVHGIGERTLAAIRDLVEVR